MQIFHRIKINIKVPSFDFIKNFIQISSDFVTKLKSNVFKRKTYNPKVCPQGCIFRGRGLGDNPQFLINNLAYINTGDLDGT